MKNRTNFFVLFSIAPMFQVTVAGLEPVASSGLILHQSVSPSSVDLSLLTTFCTSQQAEDHKASPVKNTPEKKRADLSDYDSYPMTPAADHRASPVSPKKNSPAKKDAEDSNADSVVS